MAKKQPEKLRVWLTVAASVFSLVLTIASLVLTVAYLVYKVTSDRAYREKWKDYNDCGLA